MDSGDNLWELIYSQKDEPKKEPDADYVAVNEEEEVIDELDNYIDYYEDDDEAGFQSKDHISSERREIIRASNKRNFCGVGVFSSRPFLSRLVKKRLPPFYVQSPEITILNPFTRKNTNRPRLPFAPGLNTSLRFAPVEGSITLYYQSIVRELWDRAFCSGDISGAAMALGVLSDVACLTYADFVRFVEMIRQAHAHMSDGITLRNRLDQLITSAFRDDNYRKKRAFYSLKVRLAQLFTEVLVTDGEINQAHELLLTRSNDSAFATSSSLIVIQTTLLCMKAVLYLLAHPQACGPVKIPTLHEFCSNIFTFTHVILALKAKQSKTFLRQNLGWNETATQLIRDLQQAFASTAGRVETCLTYDTLRVALCIATDQLLQAKQVANSVIKTLQLSLSPLTNTNYELTSALEINNYFRWLINYQIHITNGSSKVPSKLFNLFISYLKHGQRDASTRDLLCALLMLKLGHPIHIHLIMKDCCTLIESYSYSVSRANNRPLDAQYLHLRSWELLAAALGPIKTSSSTESNYSQSQYDMSNYTHTSSSSSSSSSSQNLFGINLHPKRQNQRCNLPDDFIRKKSDWSKSLLSQLNLGDFVEYIGQPEAWIIINSDFMTQLLEVRLRSIKPEAWFDRQQMQRAADIYDASSYNTFEEEDEDEGEDAPKQQSQIKKRKTDGNNSDSDDSGTDFEGDIASLPNISHSTKKHPITASSPYKTDKTNKGANLEEMFAQVLSENEAGDRLINQFLHHGSEALFSITNNDTDVDDVDDGEQSQSLFRSQYRNYPVEECGLWLKRAGVGVSNKKKKAFKFQPEVLYPFVELGDRQLDVLTCQIIVSAHLTGADSLFVCRGVQILLQHAILHSLDSFARAHVRKDIKVAIRHQLNDTKQTYAHICLATLTQLNIDIEKTAQFASEYASNTKKGVATQQRQKRER